MKKSMHLLNESLLSKIRCVVKDASPDSILPHIDREQVVQTAAAMLFTASLSVFGLKNAELPQEFPDTGIALQSLSDAASPSGQSSKTGALLQGSSQTGVTLREDSSTGLTEIQDSVSYAYVQPDLDILLSAVAALPDGEELFCTRPEILLSPQAEQVRSIIQGFQETGRSLGFILLDLNSGDCFSFHPDGRFYSASTMKGPYVAALNKFSPEAADEYTRDLMENTIVWSSNEDYETLHHLYGNDVMFDMTEYTAVSDSIIDDYNWYPYLTVKELAQLWIGTYFYFFEDTNEQSNWCRSLYADTAESFIGSALGEEYTVYTKAGWYTDWEDTARNDAGILRADGRDYILTIMSDSFDSYDELEELAAALNEIRRLYSGEIEMTEAAADCP
ncbi:serine hydrolase [Schaedlerella arabinosiphila]|nr:serine hydrolase [Schaedlerella arabinosiphila]KAI4439384.1 hypothetical protein C824_001871 [Schaedlerella arabinosiphila]